MEETDLKEQIKQSTKSFRVVVIVLLILFGIVGSALFFIQNYEMYLIVSRLNSFEEQLSQFDDYNSALISLREDLNSAISDTNKNFFEMYDYINDSIDTLTEKIGSLTDDLDSVNERVELITDDKSVYEAVEPSVVLINGITEDGFSNGSGIIATEDGYIITCAHVVKDTSSISITTSDGNTYAATRMKVDETSDVAILKITGNVTGLKPATFGSTNDLYMGQTAYLIGYTNSTVLLGKPTITKGVLSGTRTIENKKLIQTSAEANHGNSGGPLVDVDGKVIGILMGSLVDTDGINFCITVEDAWSFLNDVRN